MKIITQLRDDFLSLKITPTAWLGDSPSRFDTYTKYATKVDSIVEFGVYTGLSTAAFLAGNPKKLRSYDITDENLTVLDRLNQHATQHQIDFEFIIGDSLAVDIEPTDLLFIDTVHKKKHTAAELVRHSNKVKRYIIFHDTTDWPGVFQAACDFLSENHQWHIVEHCNRGSGLLVLEKYRD
jgi:hypothetical protein